MKSDRELGNSSSAICQLAKGDTSRQQTEAGEDIVYACDSFA